MSIQSVKEIKKYLSKKKQNLETNYTRTEPVCPKKKIYPDVTDDLLFQGRQTLGVDITEST